MAQTYLKLEDKDVRQLRGIAADEFQKRRRLEETDEHGYVQCCTCPTRRPWNWGMEGCHYISRRHNGTLLDPRNVHPGCTNCNRFKAGNKDKYEAFMLVKYGQDTVDELWQKANGEHHFDKDWLIQFIKDTRKFNRQRIQQLAEMT